MSEVGCLFCVISLDFTFYHFEIPSANKAARHCYRVQYQILIRQRKAREGGCAISGHILSPSRTSDLGVLSHEE